MRSFARGCRMCCVVVAAAACARGADVNVLRIDGDVIRGRVLGMADGERLRLRQGEKIVEIPRDMLMRVDVLGPPPASGPSRRGQTIYLKGGGWLAGKIVGHCSGGVIADTVVAANLELSLKELAGIRFKMADEPPGAAGLFDEALTSGPVGQDVVITVKDGRPRSFRGLVESLSADGGRFRYHDQIVLLKPELLFGVVLAAGVKDTKRPAVRVALCDGGAFDGWMEAADEDGASVRATFGRTCRLPWSRIKGLSFHSDRVVFLSDCTPTGYSFEPLFNTRWPYRMDRAVGGGSIRLDGRTFAKGIGMHSAAKLSFTVTAGFDKLVGLVGIDDAVCPRGDVVFRVTADGREVFNSGPVGGGSSCPVDFREVGPGADD